MVSDKGPDVWERARSIGFWKGSGEGSRRLWRRSRARPNEVPPTRNGSEKFGGKRVGPSALRFHKRFRRLWWKRAGPGSMRFRARFWKPGPEGGLGSTRFWRRFWKAFRKGFWKRFRRALCGQVQEGFR